MYQKINFNETSSVCKSDCQVSKICANHITAKLDIKTDGMTPNIKWDNKLNSWACEKTDTMTNYGALRYDNKSDSMQLVDSLSETYENK
jgi:hypothetical protein